MLSAPMLKQIDERIEKCCHETEKKDTHKKPIHLKDLARVDDQISKPFSGSQKFTDDHAYEAESDVDFHVTDDCRKRKRKYDFQKRVPPISTQCIDEFQFSWIDGHKTCV